MFDSISPKRRPEQRIDGDLHNREIHRNRDLWQHKPLLQKVYREFHERIRRQLAPVADASIVELGSGIGSIKQTIPNCITTDIFENPWLDRCENAYRLSFPSGSVGTLILFDVWHHLEFPGSALQEFARVLAPKGRIILFEPAMSGFGQLVYSLFHPEPIHLRRTLAWEAPANFQPEGAPYFAAQSQAHRTFVWEQITDWKRQWQVVHTEMITSFRYWLSGGFNGPGLCPPVTEPLWEWIDRRLSAFPQVFAARLLVVLEKK